MKLAQNWLQYQVLDAGEKEKLEQINQYIIRRPDPVAIWPKQESINWNQVSAFYQRSKDGGGQWKVKKVPQSIVLPYKQFKFKVALTDFKHIGLFPEQAVNWDWMIDTLSASKLQNMRVLNLFAYTGAASVAAASVDQVSEVVHVDAAKGMVEWAKENIELNNLSHKKVRFIVDDVFKFVLKEVRRNRTYHAIILDPPSYGRGPNNELWKIENQLSELMHALSMLLDKDGVFVLLNSYTTNLSASVIENVLKTTLPKGTVSAFEIGLPIKDTNLSLPAGVSGRWTK